MGATLTTLCLLAAPALSKNLGSINVKDFGEVFVCAPDWAAGAIQMHDNGFTMNGNSRLYFCNRAVDNWDPRLLANSSQQQAFRLHPGPQQCWMSLQCCCLLHQHARKQPRGWGLLLRC